MPQIYKNEQVPAKRHKEHKANVWQRQKPQELQKWKWKSAKGNAKRAPGEAATRDCDCHSWNCDGVWFGARGLALRLSLCLFHMYMASVVSMCLNTHLFIQIWPAAAAGTATAAGKTIKQVTRKLHTTQRLPDTLQSDLHWGDSEEQQLKLVQSNHLCYSKEIWSDLCWLLISYIFYYYFWPYTRNGLLLAVYPI